MIQEGIRLNHGVTSRLPRISHEPIKYKDWEIPPGVSHILSNGIYPQLTTVFFLDTGERIELLRSHGRDHLP